MARSRNIKPGFFTNDELAECHPLGRLLFAGLWTIADKEGRLDDRPKKIKAMLLPFDEADCDALLQQLNDHKFITRYQVNGGCYIQISNWKKHQNPHCKEAASEIPEPVENDKSTGQEQCKEDAEEEKKDSESSQNVESKGAPELHGARMVQASVENSLNPADSLNLIPDSLNPDPDSLDNTQAASATCEGGQGAEQATVHQMASRYAFEGSVVRLNHKDYQAWLTLYPLIDLPYELQKLDIEFSHEKPKNWFITASQKLSYQNKQAASRAPRKVSNSRQTENFAAKDYGQTEIPSWARD
ncbi:MULTISPECIES: hypothetical protein [Klebsiella/Raoultella group]|uniref:Uncharacterized protein n=1 Tax=Klebsiella oxytoca TaxID=571 RepID=A0A318FHG1_KLEOX|nr:MULTISPECIES: hypothetical protein [Klebsiella/Raoultella group]HDQ5281883.1 hypothetical protein [Raoultella ornithinolytica]PLO01824.1 hypothetical protein CWN52_07650 [Klebsiella michiganensis]PLP30121.1 hypothetical protein CWM92_10850 [Klebsiella michiganensis]PXW42136.1 hypothetical protein DET57_114128 [Klebsiella oxytoca]HED2645558.1 hypothetical protein [Klebsiella michiganensis]